jgi:very-short-patch-repair endonuclease
VNREEWRVGSVNHPNRDRARALRTNMTDTERFVWQRIRYRQIGGFKFRRQHPLGPFIVDFVCLGRKLVLELDRGQHVARAGYDAERTAWLATRSYRVFRLWNCDAVKEWEAAAQRILELLQTSTPHPPPSIEGGDLPLKGGGSGNDLPP